MSIEGGSRVLEEEGVVVVVPWYRLAIGACEMNDMRGLSQNEGW